MRTGSARPMFWRTRRNQVDCDLQSGAWHCRRARHHGDRQLARRGDGRAGLQRLRRRDAKRRPTDEELAGVDAIVYDIQDMGVRFYTYESTLGYFLEAAAKAGKEIWCSIARTRLAARTCRAPCSMRGANRLSSYWRTPVRHGMTVGELARLFNSERTIGAKLTWCPWKAGCAATGSIPPAECGSIPRRTCAA